MTKWFITNKCTNDSWILMIIIVSLVISKWDKFLPFSSLVILLLVLSSNITLSGVKRSIYYPVLILNMILFPILFAYIFIEGLSIFSKNLLNILKIILNIQNMIRQVIQIYHSMLELILQIYLLFKFTLSERLVFQNQMFYNFQNSQI